MSDLPLSPPCLILSVIAILLVIAGGCTQQSANSGDTISGVKLTKMDDSHISVAYVGAEGMANPLELEITLTDSNGRSLTQSIVPRDNTTALQVHSTRTFTGSYSGKNHIMVTGYFPDGSNKTLVNKDI